MTHGSSARFLGALSLVLASATASQAGAQSVRPGSAVQHIHAPGMDPDQHFLRDLADHNEAMVHLAHSAMQMKQTPPGAADLSGAADVAEDARKTEIVALLRRRFGDTWTPTAQAKLMTEVDALMKLEGKSYDAAMKEFTRRHHQAAIDMIDHAKLRRPEVNALAKRMRAQYVTEMGAVPAAGQ